MAKVTLLWNYRKLCDIVDEQNDLHSTIIKKAQEKCSCVGASFETLSFTKFYKQSNRHHSIDLNDIAYGDRINIVSKSSSQSMSETAPSFAVEKTDRHDDFSKSKLIKKLESNKKSVMLTGEERKFLCNYLKLHAKCSSAEKNCEELMPRRKIANLNEVESTKRRNDPPQELHTSIMRKRKSTPQTVRTLAQALKDYKPVKYDYDLIKTYLNNNYTLPPEERDEETFVACFKILFENRRAFMMASAPTVGVVKELHPYLFNKEQVFAEFELVTQQSNMFERYVNRVKKYSSSAVEVSLPCRSSLMIRDKLKRAEDGEQKQWILMAGSLLLLPKYMEEDRRSMLICDDDTFIQEIHLPYIQCHEDTDNCLSRNCHFDIFIENTKLCQVANILEAYFGLMAAYYIFDVIYPENCTKTLVLLERLYIEYTTSPIQIPQSAENRITYLKEYDYRKKFHGEVFNCWKKI